MNKCHVLWYCVTYSVVNMAYESFIQMLCILFMCFVCSVFYFFILFALSALFTKLPVCIAYN